MFGLRSVGCCGFGGAILLNVVYGLLLVGWIVDGLLRVVLLSVVRFGAVCCFELWFVCVWFGDLSIRLGFGRVVGRWFGCGVVVLSLGGVL